MNLTDLEISLKDMIKDKSKVNPEYATGKILNYSY